MQRTLFYSILFLLFSLNVFVDFIIYFILFYFFGIFVCLETKPVCIEG